MNAHRVSVALALCLAMTVGTKDARAQFSPRARSAGMAGAGLLFATGLDTVEWNPANLAWSTGWDVSLFEFGAAGLLTGATIDDLIEIASAGGDGDAAVVNRLPDDGFTLSTTVEGFASARAASVADLPEVGSSIPSVGLAIGPVALRVRSRLMAEASMSRELADLTVNGTTLRGFKNTRFGTPTSGLHRSPRSRWATVSRSARALRWASGSVQYGGTACPRGDSSNRSSTWTKRRWPSRVRWSRPSVGRAMAWTSAWPSTWVREYGSLWSAPMSCSA